MVRFSVECQLQANLFSKTRISYQTFFKICKIDSDILLAQLQSSIEIEIYEPFKHQTHRMVKHTQTICRKQPTNCLSVFDHFVGFALKVLMKSFMYLSVK